MAIATLADTQHRFSELLEEHYGIVGKVAGTYAWHHDDREELSQEIITQLWRTFSSYDQSQTFSTWMYRVALNVSISWVRRNSVRLRYMTALDDSVHEIPDTSSQPSQDERIAFLRAFIDDLDPLNRALMLLYLEERSYREIGEILGITETNVATKLSRLKQCVRRKGAALEEEGAKDGTR